MHFKCVEITNKLDPGFTALAKPLFPGIDAWLVDSGSEYPPGARGDGAGEAVEGRKRWSDGWEQMETQVLICTLPHTLQALLPK